MLVAYQLPLADSRPFLDGDTHRLARPTWPRPRLDESYIRSFGGVKKRLKGGAGDGLGESAYCRAARAVRFLPTLEGFPEPDRPLAKAFSCAFRRFLSDGRAVSRFEMGLREGPGCRRLSGLGPADCSRLIRIVLSLPVRVPTGGDTEVKCELVDFAKPLAAHYLRSTTARIAGQPQPTEPWWISPGPPLLVVEYNQDEILGLPPYCLRVPGTESWEFEFHHLSFQYKGRLIGVWFLGWKPGAVSQTALDTIRRLRIHLFRLHAERECLQQVLWAIAEKRIKITARTDASDALQRYLDESIKLLSRETFAGLPQGDIQTAQQVDDLVNPDQRPELLAQLKDIRKTLFEKLTRATGGTPAGPAGGDRPIDVFISYSHQDKALCEELRKYLSTLRRQGLIRDWYDRGIGAGEEWARTIDEHLNSANVILLLISADFLASDYCFEIETKRALERRRNGEAVVIPVLLREADWKYPPLADLEPLPKDFRPIESRVPMSAALTEVASGIREVIESKLRPAPG